MDWARACGHSCLPGYMWACTKATAERPVGGRSSPSKGTSEGYAWGAVEDDVMVRNVRNKTGKGAGMAQW